MTRIVLTPDQANLYHQAKEPVQICDTQGEVLGTLPPALTPEYIAELKRRAASPGPWYTQDDVHAMFRFLEERETQEGKIDEERLKALLSEFKNQHAKAQ